jgi:hypothetical protein
MPLKVFISYKWEDDTHNEWVERFATDLRRAGIEAILDRWEVHLGDSFTDYMTSKINEADVVLFIMTTRSVAAAEAPTGEGGALKFEIQMAKSRQIAGEELRLIGIYREGDHAVAHLRDHRYADFRDDSRYQLELTELIHDLLGKDRRPPLGLSDAPYDYRAHPGLLEKKDLILLRALYSFSLENDADIIDLGQFARSSWGQQAVAQMGDEVSDIIDILAQRGYLDDPQRAGGKMIVVSGNSIGFRVCAPLLGFPTYDKLLLSGVRRVVEHGVPMTGDEFAASMTAFGKLSATVDYRSLDD